MKKNIILALVVIAIGMILTPQIFGLETSPAAAVDSNEACQLPDFDTYINQLPSREIPAEDMPVLEAQFNDIVEVQEGNQAEANKQLDDLCFKISTYPYA